MPEATAKDVFQETFHDILGNSVNVRGPAFASAVLGAFECAQLAQALALLVGSKDLTKDQINAGMDGVLTLLSAIQSRIASGVPEELHPEIMRAADELMKRKDKLLVDMLKEIEKGEGKQG